MEIKYYINGNDLYSTYSIRVQHGYGLLDTPALKEVLVSDFIDQNGTDPDLSQPRMAANKIELDCYMKAADVSDFIEKQALFSAMLRTPGLKMLRVEITNQTPIIALVYLSEQISIEKRLKDGVIFGRFTLSLTEPNPSKVYGKIVVAEESEQTVQLVFAGQTSEIPIVINWGDGTEGRHVIDDVTTSNLSHSYDTNGTYYVCVTGNLAGITLTVTEKEFFELYPVNSWT